MEYTTFGIRFSCEKGRANKDGLSPILIFVTINKNHTVIQTKQKADPANFRKQVNSKVANPVKIYCENERGKINNIYSTLNTIPNITVTPKLIKECYLHGIEETLSNKPTLHNITLQGLFNQFMDFKSTENILPSTFKKFKFAFNTFLELTGHKPTEPASSIKHIDMLVFEAKCMNEKHYVETTTKKKMKYVRSVFNFGKSANLLAANPFGMMVIGRGEKEEPTQYLEYDEIVKVREADLRADRLIKARDIFLFQCFTGLNISDIKVLKPEDIQEKDGYYYIEKARYKQGKFNKKYKYTTILFEDAIEVYKAYKGNIPYESPQKLNVYLGDIMKIAGIDKHITSKCGRTSFANYVFNRLHIDIPIISKMMGHSSVKQTEEYLTIFTQTVFDCLDDKGNSSIEEEAEAWENDIEPDYQTQQLYKKLWGE